MEQFEAVTDAVPSFDLEKESAYGFLPNLTLLSMVLTSLSRNNKAFPNTKPHIKDSYDYIIVGAGTAGSVMAYRLSEKPCVTVLLLEAGGEPPLLTEVPGAGRIFLRSNIDWLYKSEPQKHGAFGQKENRVVLNNGKVLGGSSILNAMVYARGNKQNYDDWKAQGATGWSYDEVLPYFIKLEDNRNIEELDPGYHRQGGPMTAEKINYNPEVKNPILRATADMGYEARDVNGFRQTGMYDMQATVRNQQRCSTAKAYLVPAEDRPNLDIVKNAFVRKIIIKNRRAVGVEVDYPLGNATVVRANEEVIVSNGAIRTPQLLMLSGIGPRKELDKFNIDVVADLPVGKNLQDHYGTILVYQISDKITPVVAKNLDPVNVLDYVLNRKGPLTAPCQLTVVAFLDGLNTTSYSVDFPRQELHFAEYSTTDIKLNSNLKDEVYEKYYGPYEEKPLFVCFASLLQPESRGEITLKSTDPYDHPKIDPNYYGDERDLKDVVEGLKICQAVAKHPEMRKVESRPLDTVFPGCENYVHNEDKYFGCIAKHMITTIYHYSGTAKMGQPNDSTSVVDPELRVIGVKGLRVVSAAVMPIVPSGNTNVPIMMVAEKAYDMMKNDIQCRGTRKVFKNAFTFFRDFYKK